VKAKRKAKKAPATKKASKRKAPKAASLAGKLINLKVSPAQKAAIGAHAKKHAGGNFSRWVRYAAQHFKPTKADLQALAS
jgi:hypothetical protein